jgi:hypothetical protein
MSITLTIYDETLTGEKTACQTLDFAVQRITVRDLIRDRIHQEVQTYNQTQPEYFRGLVQPNDAEVVLNRYKLPQQRSIDWEEQYEKALQVFEHGGFMVLVNDCQVEALETELTLTDNTTISFLRTYLKVAAEAEVSPVKQNVEAVEVLSNVTLKFRHIFTTMTGYAVTG